MVKLWWTGTGKGTRGSCWLVYHCWLRVKGGGDEGTKGERVRAGVRVGAREGVRERGGGG